MMAASLLQKTCSYRVRCPILLLRQHEKLAIPGQVVHLNRRRPDRTQSYRRWAGLESPPPKQAKRGAASFSRCFSEHLRFAS